MARILAVDDDALVRRCIQRILRRQGHEVVEASHGAQALRLLQDRSFDIALVDYQLPQMDGIEVLQKLREVQPACLRMLITGQLDLPMVLGAVNRGEVTRVLEKPFETSALVSAVDEMLHTRRVMQDVLKVQEEASAAEEREQLVECLSGDYIRVALQPIVDAPSGDTHAFECLLRSTHPVLNGPLPVLNAAERHGMLPEVARVVSSRVRDWFLRLPDGVRLFMNLHPDELADPDGMVERLRPLAPWANRVVLEITERSRLQGIDHWERAVEEATRMGFSIAVDDLGAGYSSLSVLAELQPSYIKVDMSIVRGVDTDPRKRRLVDLLCRFAEATEARLVAEGVETATEAEALRSCGAHLLQGYFFGKPSFTPVVQGQSATGVA
jgi:EAL domain-containing protein (putative c-di-GMP-specific phosphodiesterase class I)/CheY-like chemotaxis protein